MIAVMCAFSKGSKQVLKNKLTLLFVARTKRLLMRAMAFNWMSWLGLK